MPKLGAAADTAGRELFRRSREALFVVEAGSDRVVELNPSAERLVGATALGRRAEELDVALDWGAAVSIGDGLMLVTPGAQESAETRELRHSLGSPLTAILGFVELLLEREYPADRQRQLLERVRSESERLAGMIEELNGCSLDAHGPARGVESRDAASSPNEGTR